MFSTPAFLKLRKFKLKVGVGIQKIILKDHGPVCAGVGVTPGFGVGGIAQ
jgi:hypothetical protein